MKIVQQRSVGAILGQDSVEKSIVAGSVGLALVVAFMLIYYRLPGLLAVMALAMYAAVVFALFKLIPVVLTLAGIAGFVLSIGMAVDANILIFERLKESYGPDIRCARRWSPALAGVDLDPRLQPCHPHHLRHSLLGSVPASSRA